MKPTINVTGRMVAHLFVGDNAFFEKHEDKDLIRTSLVEKIIEDGKRRKVFETMNSIYTITIPRKPSIFKRLVAMF
jgi:hypothetical protein